MMGEDARGYFALAILLVLGTPLTVWVIRTVRRQREMRRQWAQRPPVSHEAFCTGCGVPPDEWSRGLALAARGALAEATGVPPHTIYADDPFNHHFWDSLDQRDVIFRIEKAALIRLPRGPGFDAFNQRRRGESGPVVKDFVQAVLTDARQ